MSPIRGTAPHIGDCVCGCLLVCVCVHAQVNDWLRDLSIIEMGFASLLAEMYVWVTWTRIRGLVLEEFDMCS